MTTICHNFDQKKFADSFDAEDVFSYHSPISRIIDSDSTCWTDVFTINVTEHLHLKSHLIFVEAG